MAGIGQDLKKIYSDETRIVENASLWSGVKATVFGVVEDLKFKISEVSDQNWCFPDCAQLAVSAKLRQLTGQSQENTNLGPNILKFKTLGPQLLQKL